jgi:hypothetical protein
MTDPRPEAKTDPLAAVERSLTFRTKVYIE